MALRRGRDSFYSAMGGESNPQRGRKSVLALRSKIAALVIMMLRLRPPIWSLTYVLIATGISSWLGWPRVPGLPLVALGIAVVIAGLILPV